MTIIKNLFCKKSLVTALSLVSMGLAACEPQGTGTTGGGQTAANQGGGAPALPSESHVLAVRGAGQMRVNFFRPAEWNGFVSNGSLLVAMSNQYPNAMVIVGPSARNETANNMHLVSNPDGLRAWLAATDPNARIQVAGKFPMLGHTQEGEIVEFDSNKNGQNVHMFMARAFFGNVNVVITAWCPMEQAAMLKPVFLRMISDLTVSM